MMINARVIFLAASFSLLSVTGQDAAPKERNEVNTRLRPGSMFADSPVAFPDKGCLPSKYHSDVKQTTSPSEKEYYIFSSPCRSVKQIDQIQSEMPKGNFKAVPQDRDHLQQTFRKLNEGGELHILGLGDSIVNDTMRSAWIAKLQDAYPKAKILSTVYVRGGGGCQHYREDGRVAKYILPLQPDMIYIGGISQRSVDDIRAVILEIRKDLPDVEFLLASGTFGTTDPRDEVALAAAPHSGSSQYGKDLKALAKEQNCAYLDMTTPWAEYIRTSGLHPHLFYRDAVHANEYGEQILCQIMMSFWGP